MSKKAKVDVVNNKKTASATATTKSMSRWGIIAYLGLLIIFWSAALFMLAKDEWDKADAQTNTLAINKTQGLLEKDIAYYQWVGSQSDIYFVKALKDQANAANGDGSSQNIELMQFTADVLLGLSQNSWAKRTGSIIVIYTDASQAQDESQSEALKLMFAGEAPSVSGVRRNGDKEFMSIMLPLEYSGNKESGGKVTKVISLQYPMQEFKNIGGQNNIKFKYGIAWIAGLVVWFIVLSRFLGNWNTVNSRREVEQTKEKVDNNNVSSSSALSKLQNTVSQPNVGQSQDLIQNFMDQIPLPIYIKNEDGVFTSVNKSFADTLGCSKENLVGTIGTYYVPAKVTEYLAQFENMAFNLGQQVATGDFKFIDDSLYSGVVFPVKGEFGRLMGVSMILTPVNEKSANQAVPAATVNPYADEIQKPQVSMAKEFTNDYQNVQTEKQHSAANLYSEDFGQQQSNFGQQQNNRTAIDQANQYSEKSSKPMFDYENKYVEEAEEQEQSSATSILFGTAKSSSAKSNTDSYFTETVTKPQDNFDKAPVESIRVESAKGEQNLFSALQAKEHNNVSDSYQPVNEPVVSAPVEKPVSTMPPPANPSPVAEVFASKPVNTRSSVILNVLVIDDDLNEAQTLADDLIKLGHNVKVFDNASSGVEALTTQRFDMVFMDIQMPVMNGIQATAIIRKHERQASKARTPIIAIATHAAPGDKDKYKVCGMDNFVLTSTSVNELAGLIEETIAEFNLKR